MYLDDYRNVNVTPNFEKPRITKEDTKKGKRELFVADLICYFFIFTIGTIFSSIAYATGDAVLSTFGVIWLQVYVILTFVISARHTSHDGSVYLLVDKIMTTDEDIGLTQCLFILYNDETDTYYKTETMYHIYRDALVGDWVFMYMTEDNIFVIPEYPNAKWKERRCLNEKES